MRIIKEGNPDFNPEIIFVCGWCGCEFAEWLDKLYEAPERWITWCPEDFCQNEIYKQKHNKLKQE